MRLFESSNKNKKQYDPRDQSDKFMELFIDPSSEKHKVETIEDDEAEFNHPQ